MKTIQEHSQEALVWRRIKPLQPQYELRAGEEVVGRLLKGVISSKADLETAEGQWEIKREGLFRTRLVIRDAHSRADAGAMPWSSARRLELPDGRSYQFTGISMGLTSDESGLFTGAGERLLSIRAEGMANGHRGLVRIEPAAEALADLALLVGLTWYAMLLATQDRAVQAGGMGATGG